jgi:hypothetical protein
MGRRGSESGTDALSQMSTCRSRCSGEATTHRGTGARTNALSRRRGRETEPRRRDGLLRQRFLRECFIADVNAQGTGSGGAMSRRGSESGTDALSQMSTCRSRCSGEATTHRGTGARANTSRGVAHGRRSRGDAMDRRGDGFGTNALSQMSTCRSRAAVRRQLIEATGSARMLCRRCQRAEVGSR